MSETHEPMVTTVDQQTRRRGAVATRRLVSVISAEGKKPEQLTAQALEAIREWQDAQEPTPEQ